MNNHERKIFTFPYDIPDKFRKRMSTLNTNLVPDAILTVSPNGEFFILRDFSGKCRLIRSETDEEITLLKAKHNHYGGEEIEIPLGFNASNDLFCGTQCLNPLLVIRDIDMRTLAVNEEYKKDYKFGRLSFPADIGLTPEYWLDKDISHDNIGILYSILPPPEENSISGTTVLPFTTFQFRFLMAMVVVYDSKSGFDHIQTLVDTTRWFEKDKVFFWSIDGRYLAILDGTLKLQIYDTKTKSINICNIFMQAKEIPFGHIKKAWFLSNGEMVIVIAGMSSIFPQIIVWSPESRKFSGPFFTSNLPMQVLSVSPQGDYIATAIFSDDVRAYWDIFSKKYIDQANTIEIWSTKDKKKVHTLKLNSLSDVYFAPDWSLLELERFDNDNQKMVSEVIDLSNILPLQNSSIHQVREWNSTVGTKTNAKYISSTETAVKLEKEDGKIITVPLVKLSQEDQEYVKQLAEEDEKDK
jgi:hypothetical protein